MSQPGLNLFERVVTNLGVLAALPFVFGALLIALPFCMIVQASQALRAKSQPQTPLEAGREILAGFFKDREKERGPHA